MTDLLATLQSLTAPSWMKSDILRETNPTLYVLSQVFPDGRGNIVGIYLEIEKTKKRFICMDRV